MSAIIEAINRVTDSGKEIYSIVGVVEEIDDSKRVCVVAPMDGSAKLYGVRLQSERNSEVGWCIYPKKDTKVVVTFLNKNTGYVALCTEVDKVIFKVDEMTFEASKDGFVFNGGDLGGLVKAKELKTQVDKNTAALVALQNTIKVFVPVPSDGGAKLKADLMASFTNKQLADLSNIENDKIKH